MARLLRCGDELRALCVGPAAAAPAVTIAPLLGAGSRRSSDRLAVVAVADVVGVVDRRGRRATVWPLVVFSAGVWLTRSAGCVVNDYADRWLDPQVERTRDRPLATGAISGREALAVFAVLMLAAFALVLTLNRLTVYLSFVGVLLAASYPYLKRHTYLPQVYLGMAFGWGIPMAFAAIRGEVPAVAWVLYVANIFWATAYDTWYAMVDRDDDLRAGAKSTAILFGDMDLVAQGVLYALTFAALALVGRRAHLGWYYWCGLGVPRCWCCTNSLIARHRDRDACFRAFLHNHWVGAAIFAGIAADYALH